MTISFTLALIIFLTPGWLYGQSLSNAPAERDIETERTNTVELTGPWYYYPFSLLKPGDNFENGEKIFLPHLWKSQEHAVGFCTYRYAAMLPSHQRSRPMAIYMPDTYCSYRVWIDGQEFTGNGTVGASLEISEPEWRPQQISFVSGNQSLEIVIQVSNFHHHKGGMGKIPVLGPQKKIRLFASLTLLGGSVLFSCMLIIASTTFFLSLKQRSRELLLFALLTLSWSLRSVFSNDYLAVYWFPGLPWEWVVRIEYVTIYLTTVFGLLLVSSLFKNRISRTFNFFYISTALIFTLVTLFTEPIFFTQYVLVYLGFSAFLIVRIIYLAIEAFVNDCHGATLLLANIFAGALLFMYVILAYVGLIRFYQSVFDLGFLIIFGSGSISITRKFFFRKSGNTNAP